MPPRTIAIGDIHGCSVALAALLEAVALRPEDTVVTLGDYVNKGLDSRGVLDQMLALRDRCRLVPLLGNHDAIMLAAIDGQLTQEAWMAMGGMATLQSYPGEQIESVPDDHVAFLRGCRLFHETTSHIFVHANYHPDLAMGQQDEQILLWQSLRDELPGPHCSGKTAIVGHTSQKDGEILDVGHLICIDTYCWGGGWLTALEIESGQIRQVDERGRERTGR